LFRSDWASLKDVSASGAGLLLDGAAEPGDVLLLRLPASVPGGALARRAQIAHVTRRPSGLYLVGCRFTPPLTQGELDSVLQRIGKPA
jgi:hypothetical protein